MPPVRSNVLINFRFNFPILFTVQVKANETVCNETYLVAFVTFNITDCSNSTNLSSRCSNNGYCIDDGNNYNLKFTCRCLSNYIDIYCETFVKTVYSPSGNTIGECYIIGIGCS